MIPSLVGSDVILEMIDVAKSTPEGCFVEVGVYKGGTAQHLQWIAELQNRSVYLYDTFTGIPYRDSIDTHNVGDFGDVSFERVCSAFPKANVVQGIFPASAVRMPPVAFAHIDCDQYRSVKESIEYLVPKMVRGGIIWFDDYGLEGAKMAINEAFKDHITTKTNKVYIRI